eukprot:Gb_02814 [translate_table: standard]
MAGPSTEPSSNNMSSIQSRVLDCARQCWSNIHKHLQHRSATFRRSILSLYETSFSHRTRRRRRGLPLPFPSRHTPSTTSSMQMADKVTELLEEMSEQILASLHDVQKSLRFWQSRAEGTDARKVRFMVFERGPWAFIEGTIHLVHGFIIEGSPVQHLVLAAASRISERVSVLTSLQRHLATLLAQIHKQVDQLGEDVAKELNHKEASSLLVAIQSFMIELEHSYDLPQSDYSVLSDGTQNASVVLQFETIPEELERKSEWTDAEIEDVVTLIYENLRRLDQCLSLLVSKYRRPRRVTRLWFRYVGGAVGLAVCSGWLLSHSQFMGSTDLDDWLREGRESTLAFWKDHVELPLLSIRDELFETFRRRHKGSVELEEVQLTANSLHRMLLAFSEQTTGKNLPEGASEQEMMEIMMARYEKELMHPLQSLLGGELAHALLIQIQKLKLDIETAMLELNQILRANEINFAILAALPAFFIIVILARVVQIWLMQEKGAEGKGRAARLQRRLLVVEVEKKIIQCQVLSDERREKDALWSFGMILYTLDRLYKVTERHAKASGEWQSLRMDILDLAKPRLAMQFKLAITARMERAYECLVPSSRRLL